MDVEEEEEARFTLPELHAGTGQGEGGPGAAENEADVPVENRRLSFANCESVAESLVRGLPRAAEGGGLLGSASRMVKSAQRNSSTVEIRSSVCRHANFAANVEEDT